MRLVKPRRILINRMRNHAAHASDFRSRKAAPQHIRQ
jgi:hypothetical protein